MSTLPISSDTEFKDALKARFLKHPHRHPNVSWADIESRLNGAVLGTLREMEDTGGEVDVVLFADRRLAYVDFAKETPLNRRSLCYDQEALDARKQAKPQGSAVGWAMARNLRLTTETEYRALQAFEPLDLKTSSWIDTPKVIRNLGGALFCDRRYDQVFVYHNGADSYYGARAFRAVLDLGNLS
jgi:hypothetical protein